MSKNIMMSHAAKDKDPPYSPSKDGEEEEDRQETSSCPDSDEDLQEFHAKLVKVR